jgi:hypothetical protein
LTPVRPLRVLVGLADEIHVRSGIVALDQLYDVVYGEHGYVVGESARLTADQ